MTSTLTNNDICCAEFNPALWKNRTFEWHEQMFIEASHASVFHIPLPGVVGKTITSLWDIATQENIAYNADDSILLSYDPSAWKTIYYLNVKSPSAKGNNTTLTGKFETKVFDGPYHHVPKFIKAMNLELADKGLKASKYYCYYTTCPKCAKKYGHNYIVLFAKVDE